MLDVGRPGGVIAATERAFGSNPRLVAITAVPFARGLEAGGVVATAKHFPGLGAATENTDFAAQRIERSQSQLRLVDEAPYEAYVRAGGRMVMLSTAIYPAFSPAPAAFSRAIATGELRRRLGFRGVSISDALETVAVEAFGGPAQAAVAGTRAGTDLLLFTDLAGAEAAGRALVAKLRQGRLDRGSSWRRLRACCGCGPNFWGAEGRVGIRVGGGDRRWDPLSRSVVDGSKQAVARSSVLLNRKTFGGPTDARPNELG